MRSFFLFLSRQKHLRKWMETSSLAKRFAARFVAGETLDQALAVSRRLNSEGISITLDHLGESVSSLEEAAEARDVYVRTLSAIHDSGIQGNVSLKLTQFGIDISYEQCLANVESWSAKPPNSAASSAWIWKQAIIPTVPSSSFPPTWTVPRSVSSFRRICTAAARTWKSFAPSTYGSASAKGAYLEPADVAFPNKSEVDSNFVELMKLLLDGRRLPGHRYP